MEKDDQDMLYIEKFDTDSKPAEPGKVLPLNRVAFATDLTQSAFGHSYVPPSQADFCDHTPAEVQMLRAEAWARR